MADDATPPTHVVLIRGINVGGNNPVAMLRLCAALIAAGLDDARSYIQSGNVVVAAPGQSEVEVSGVAERVLADEFDVHTVVVTVAAERMRAAISDVPKGFGTEPDLYHYDVAFLRPGVDSADVMPACGVREVVDAVWAGKGVVYFRRLSAERTKSRMSTIMSSPHYKSMTIRNWRTTTALLTMFTADTVR